MKYYTGILLLFMVTLTGCLDVKDQKTTLQIVDNNRHYYPILQGQEQDIVFTVKNTGSVPFMLKDMIVSCGCLTSQKSSIDAIPAGKEGQLIMKFNSTKNVGYVRNYITLYGNLLKTDKIEIIFDINVVPNSLYTKDYEELFQEEKNKGGKVKDLVDGEANNKGYYMDGDFAAR